MTGPPAVRDLPLERRIELERRLRSRRLGRPADDAIRRRGSDGPAPASLAQHRLWLVELFAPLRGIDLDVAPRDEDDREAPSF